MRLLFPDFRLKFNTEVIQVESPEEITIKGEFIKANVYKDEASSSSLLLRSKRSLTLLLKSVFSIFLSFNWAVRFLISCFL